MGWCSVWRRSSSGRCLPRRRPFPSAGSRPPPHRAPNLRQKRFRPKSSNPLRDLCPPPQTAPTSSRWKATTPGPKTQAPSSKRPTRRAAAKNTWPAGRAASKTTPASRRRRSRPRSKLRSPLRWSGTARSRRSSSCTPTPPRTTASRPGCGSAPATAPAPPTGTITCAQGPAMDGEDVVHGAGHVRQCIQQCAVHIKQDRLVLHVTSFLSSNGAAAG